MLAWRTKIFYKMGIDCPLNFFGILKVFRFYYVIFKLLEWGDSAFFTNEVIIINFRNRPMPLRNAMRWVFIPAAPPPQTLATKPPSWRALFWIYHPSDPYCRALISSTFSLVFFLKYRIKSILHKHIRFLQKRTKYWIHDMLFDFRIFQGLKGSTLTIFLKWT